MKTANQIGNDAEKKVQAYLERDGWFVCRAWRQYIRTAKGPMCTTADFFHCFDIIALKPGNKPVFIAVTTRRDMDRIRQKFRGIRMHLDEKYGDFQAWQVQGKGATVYLWPTLFKEDGFKLAEI